MALGLGGKDPDADLAAARAAWASGDLVTATDQATLVSGTLAVAGDAGRGRALVGGVGVAIVVLLLGVLVIVWSRGRRERRRMAIVAAAMGDNAAPIETVEPSPAADDVEVRTAGPPDGVTAPPRRIVRGSGHAGAVPRPTDDRESAYELFQRGQDLIRRRHHAQAAVVLERAARLEPGKGSILEALGRAYFNSSQHERARETFEALLELDPSAHYAHYALGQSLKRLGREREAWTHLRLAVALAPSSDLYRSALARIPDPRDEPDPLRASVAGHMPVSEPVVAPGGRPASARARVRAARTGPAGRRRRHAPAPASWTRR